jgi:programmed cell death 6-interacting protein
MYSQIALSSNRATSEGLKSAASNFCFSAGVINYLKTDIIPELRSNPPEDMDTLTLESVESLMLAQAQECFWQKAVKDGLKDASISKLAAKVSDLYSDTTSTRNTTTLLLLHNIELLVIAWKRESMAKKSLA